MLRKLMKYDFKTVFKLWWIGAVTTFALSFAGGFLGEFFVTEREIPEPILVVAIFGLVLVYIGFLAFGIFGDILVYLRYYKNLFTDEGYLTFTLPVKRQSILNSKIFLGLSTSVLSSTVITIDTIIVTLISYRSEIFTQQFFKDVMDFAKDFFDYKYYYFFFIYLIEALVILLLVVLASILFAYACIAVASVVVKKAKILVAIGIYYGATSIISFILTIFYLFGITSLFDLLFELSELATLNSVWILLLMIIFVLCAVCCLLYYVTHWCLDKKLNLA